MASAEILLVDLDQHAQAEARQAQPDQALRVGGRGEAGLDADAHAMQPLDDRGGTELGQVDRGVVGQLAPGRHVGEPAVVVALDPGAGADADQRTRDRRADGGHGGVDIGGGQALAAVGAAHVEVDLVRASPHHRCRVGSEPGGRRWAGADG